MIVNRCCYLLQTEMSTNNVNHQNASYKMLEYLDFESLQSAELVSTIWRKAVVDGRIYKKLFNRNVRTILSTILLDASINK